MEWVLLPVSCAVGPELCLKAKRIDRYEVEAVV
jgi:hypothetical protein